MSCLDFIFTLLGKLSSKSVTPSPQPPITPQIPKSDPPPPPAIEIPEKKTLPTRDEVLKVFIGLVEGTLTTKVGKGYKLLRETHGQNRSPELDGLIKRQGGSLGEPYCQYGMQEALDDLCTYYKIDRKKVKIPEGGSTQLVLNTVKKGGTYYVDPSAAPLPLYWVTWVNTKNTTRGHVGMVTGGLKQDKFPTFEFNTSGDTTSVNRNGQGCYYLTRTTKQVGDMKIRGYTDVYQALIDAMEV